MSRIWCGTLVFVLGLASVSFAFEPAQVGYQNYPEQTSAPVPSGLRFTGIELSVRTGHTEGGYGYGGCNSCGQAGYCAPWTAVPWFGSWDEPHYHGGCHRGGRCCSPCGY